jgi:hypothetical protein
LQKVIVQNIGTGVVDMAGLALTGDFGFSVPAVHDGCGGSALTPGQTCVVRVRFTPTASGPRSATLTFEDSNTGSTASVGLSGNAVAVPGIARVTPVGPLTFTAPVGGRSKAQKVTLKNVGGESIPIGIWLKTGNFEFVTPPADACPLSLEPGEYCSLKVRFLAASPGVSTGSLSHVGTVITTVSYRHHDHFTGGHRHLRRRPAPPRRGG